nr:uncharacterized protein LOC109181161 [Ipomoea batatas]
MITFGESKFWNWPRCKVCRRREARWDGCPIRRALSFVPSPECAPRRKRKRKRLLFARGISFAPPPVLCPVVLGTVSLRISALDVSYSVYDSGLTSYVSCPVADPAVPLKSTKVEKFKPISRDSKVMDLWKSHSQRGLLVPKDIDLDDIMKHCNIITLLKDQDLLQTI